MIVLLKLHNTKIFCRYVLLNPWISVNLCPHHTSNFVQLLCLIKKFTIVKFRDQVTIEWLAINKKSTLYLSAKESENSMKNDVGRGKIVKAEVVENWIQTEVF